ncbi:hypothetical protein B0O80DRAFT_475612 [Mortierella sp. GBAus27b]|nr:hypothetical protein B0O80DRAFT_475612 [Mortierella sp. GBAus27b]
MASLPTLLYHPTRLLGLLGLACPATCPDPPIPSLPSPHLTHFAYYKKQTYHSKPGLFYWRSRRSFRFSKPCCTLKPEH